MADAAVPAAKHLLAADIGGTTSRFGHFLLAPGGGLTLVSQVRLSTLAAASFDDLLAALPAAGFDLLPAQAAAAAFAAQHGDTTFDIRLALGLGRSLITSTRFELSERFARLMFNRGVFLLQRVAAHTGDPAEFKLPIDALCY